MFPSYPQSKPVPPKTTRSKQDSIAYPLSYSHDIEPEHFRGYELLITLAAGIIVVISLWPMISKAAAPEVPEFCAGGFEKTEYSGKFVWKTGKPLKVRIGSEKRNPGSAVAHIFDRTGKCLAVCQASTSSQNMKNPTADGEFDFQCVSSPEFQEFASHVVIAPHPERAPAVFHTPLIRFGTYLRGYSEAILQVDARHTNEPILAGN